MKDIHGKIYFYKGCSSTVSDFLKVNSLMDIFHVHFESCRSPVKMHMHVA